MDQSVLQNNLRLNFAVVCDNAFRSEDGKLNLIGIFKKISADTFPATHPKFFAVVSLGYGKEMQKKISQRLSLSRAEDEKKKALPDLNIDLDINPDDKDGEVNGIIEIQGATFDSSGQYILRVFVDGVEVGSTSFFVTKTEQN